MVFVFKIKFQEWFVFFLTEHFECVLQVLYNVVYIKAIAATSCTFTSEEREAWRKKGRHVCTDTL